jgi:hypothetical protein
MGFRRERHAYDGGVPGSGLSYPHLEEPASAAGERPLVSPVPAAPAANPSGWLWIALVTVVCAWWLLGGRG